MKHFVVKLAVVVAIGLFALPQLYAQDTTITIYGKKFAPGVIVKINGRLVDSANIRRDSAQPSRVLYVKFPLSWLNKPAAAIAGVKDAGASLTSNEVGNIVEVGNPPGTEMASSTFYTRPASPKIFFTAETQNDSLARVRISVPVGTTGDSTLRVRFTNIPVGTDIRLQVPGLDSLQFGVYDSTGMQRIWSFRTTARQTTFAFKVKYVAPSRLPALASMMTVGSLNLSATISGKSITRTLSLEAVPVQIIQVLAAFTLRAKNQPFYDTLKYDTVLNGRISQGQDAPKQLAPSPTTILKNCLTALHSYLSTLNQSSGILAQTRFQFIEEPFQISYSENTNSASGNLHSDIDFLQGSDLDETSQTGSFIPEISQKQMNLPPQSIILLITNSEVSHYRAIASSCSTTKIPKYLIVEARYIESFINSQFIDKRMIDDLQAALQQ